MTKRAWSKARKWRETEEKYAVGSVLGNGRLVFEGPRDSLAARAAQMERDWLYANQHDSRIAKFRRNDKKHT